MTTKRIVGKAMEVVTFLLAGFSGFLTEIAPPEETGTRFAVGVASFTTVLVFLFVLTLAKGKLREAHKKYWYIAAAVLSICFAVSSFIYQETRNAYTFVWPPNSESKKLYVAGDRLTPQAQLAQNQNPSLTSTKLVAGFGGIDERASVWFEDSIRRVGRKLLIEYVLMVVSIAASIFCLTEGLLLKRSSKPGRREHPKVQT